MSALGSGFRGLGGVLRTRGSGWRTISLEPALIALHSLARVHQWSGLCLMPAGGSIGAPTHYQCITLQSLLG